jgi:hypothetical protein
MEYYPAIMKNKILFFAGKMKIIILSEISWFHKDRYHVYTHMEFRKEKTKLKHCGRRKWEGK